MPNNTYLSDKMLALDDEAFVEVIGAVTARMAITEEVPNDEIVHISELDQEISDEYASWGKHSGLSTGLYKLDMAILGLKPGHLILIGGETSNGKSALATNIAVNVAKTGAGVLYITLEMLPSELGARIKHMNDGKIDNLNLMFQKTYALTYKDIRSVFQRAQDMGEVKLVVLDYLQYLGRGMSLDEVAKMSKAMKQLALEYKVPFIVIVSLRKGDGKFKRKWTDIDMSDLMGTAAIAYDADIAMIVSRKNLENEFDNDRVFAKILKTRNTALDYTNNTLEFRWDKTRISDL